MEKIRYDKAFKSQVIKEYLETDSGYKKLSAKYNVSRDTIKGWITHYKRISSKNNAIEIINTNNLIDITDQVKRNMASISEPVPMTTFYINGFAITANKESLVLIMEAINDARFKSN